MALVAVELDPGGVPFTDVKSLTFKWDDLECFHRGWRHRGGHILWTPHYLHNAFAEAGMTVKLHKLLQKFKVSMSKIDFIELPRDVVLMPRPAAGAFLPYDVVSTLGISTSISQTLVANATKSPVKEVCRRWLESLAKIAVIVIEKGGADRQVPLGGGGVLTICTPSGVVNGVRCNPVR